jgi:alpha-L-fucosidase
MPAQVKITHIDLREQVGESQRIEAFSLYAKTNAGEWEKIYSGTTVGYRKICRFSPIQTTSLLVKIEQSRIYPTLRFVGAYFDGQMRPATA